MWCLFTVCLMCSLPPRPVAGRGNVHTWVFGLYFFQFYGVIIDTHHCQFEADSMVIWSTCVM